MNFQTTLKILPVSVLNAFYYESWKQYENDESEELLKIIECVESELREREVCSNVK